MPERQNSQSDKDLIDRLTDTATPSQQGRAGGGVNTSVGTRAELDRATDPESREAPAGSDNPAEDAGKGEKTVAALQQARNES